MTPPFPERRSSDLQVEGNLLAIGLQFERLVARRLDDVRVERAGEAAVAVEHDQQVRVALAGAGEQLRCRIRRADLGRQAGDDAFEARCIGRSEEHTSELQSLMRISYAVFCL